MKPKVFLNYANTREGNFGQFTAVKYLEYLQKERIRSQNAIEACQEVIARTEAVADLDSNVIPWLKEKDNTKDLVFFSFSGHASGGELMFEDQTAQCNGLASYIGRRYCPNLKLVLLNGCLTNSCLEAFKKEGIPIIITTNTAVDDLRAMKFGTAFIEELAQGRTVDEAFDRALSLLEITAAAAFYKECYGTRMGRRQHETNTQLSEWQISFREDHFRNWRLSMGVKDPPDPNASSKLFDKKAPNPDHAIYAVNRYEQRVNISNFWDTHCLDKQLIHVFLEGELKHRPISFARRWLNELQSEGNNLIFDFVELQERKKELRVFKRPDLDTIKQLVLQLIQGKGKEVKIVLVFEINLEACNIREIEAWARLISGNWLKELPDFEHQIIQAYHCLPKPDHSGFFAKLLRSRNEVTNANELWKLAQQQQVSGLDCIFHLETKWGKVEESHLEKWANDYASRTTVFMGKMKELVREPFPQPMSTVQDHLAELLEQEYPHHY